MVQNANGTESREVLLNVADIHKAILEWNQQHFHQADDTPFAGGAQDTILYDVLGYTGMSKAAKDMVDGKSMEMHGDKCDLLPETEWVIRELAMPEEIKVLGKKIDSALQGNRYRSGPSTADAQEVPSKGMGDQLC